MNKFQLKNFKMNADVAAELADKVAKTEDGFSLIASMQYPSILRLLSDNLLRNFEQFECRVLIGTGEPITVTPADTPRIFIPVVGGDKASIKFKDGVTFGLTSAVAFESQEYTLTIPAGEKLVILASPINYDHSYAKFTTNKLETFVHTML